jgi:hypothetical protein
MDPGGLLGRIMPEAIALFDRVVEQAQEQLYRDANSLMPVAHRLRRADPDRAAQGDPWRARPTPGTTPGPRSSGTRRAQIAGGLPKASHPRPNLSLCQAGRFWPPAPDALVGRNM